MSRWNSIGPSVVKKGQGGVQPDTSGRVNGIAVSQSGNIVYVATANGGVWRSDNTGQSWRSLMDAFDLNPQHASSDSLACGAVAIDLNNPNLVYVGTGDGPGAAYNGVGPIVSDDGGNNWNTESTAPGSPPLAGSTFYALSIDPMNPDRVVAGTRKGVYRREPNGSGNFHWASKDLANGRASTSVVSASKNNVTTFFAAHMGSKVYSSTDGDTWSVLGTGFPTAGLGQVRLAVQPNNPDMLYALMARTGGSLFGVWRWNRSDGVWREVNGAPSDLFGTSGNYQGWYDIAIAVDPNDDKIIYLGGSTKYSNNDWSGSVYRSAITSTGQSYNMTNTYIGNSVHADIHSLVFTPTNSDKLWLGCDGGIFYSTNAKSGSVNNLFSSLNKGLSTLMMEHMGQDPTNKDLLFCGTQDNGGLKFTGNSEWLYSSGGDAGFQIVNWADPSRVLSSYVEERVRRSTSGGSRYSYSDVSVPISSGEPVLFYAPMVGTQHNPGNPAEAEIVAFGSVRPWISTDFGSSWKSIPGNSLTTDRLTGHVRSLVFASATKLYAGTTSGRIYRFDESGGNWTRTQIDTMGGADTLPFNGIVTDIAIDHLDPSGNSAYISFGGHGDYRHVWHFDGTRWEQRSGPATNSLQRLLDVHANAIITDPDNPTHIYVGMDIGCWRSTNSGTSWEVFSEGLPDSAVMDLKIHPSRVIRVSTHGRGMFERSIVQATTNTPDAPTALSFSVVSSTQIDLRWIPPLNNGGSPITGYRIQRRIGSSAWNDLSAGNVNSYSDTNLAPDTTYDYQVSATNSVGYGDVSSMVSATTLPATGGLDAPANFGADAISTSQINLRWNHATNTGGIPVASYMIRRKEAASGTWVQLPSVQGTETSFSDTGLIRSKTYNYEITATNSVGTSTPSKASATTRSCFILTAAYGSELETRAYYAHDFINEVLLKSRFKMQFNFMLRIYFKLSPPVANLMNRNKQFKYIIKYSVATPFLAITRVVATAAKPFVKKR